MILNKVALFTTLRFIILSCAVDVNQPVEVEDNNTFSSKKIFNAIVNHIGWKVSNSRFSRLKPADGVSYVDLSILLEKLVITHYSKIDMRGPSNE